MAQDGKRDGKPQAKRVAYDPKRAHGSPAIGFPAKQKPPEWQLRAGAAFSLELLVRSTGGRGRGLFVQLEGEALSQVDVHEVVCGACRARFERHGTTLRAELPDVELIDGVRYPLDPPPKNDKQKERAEEILAACHVSLVVHGNAKQASRELLRVSCGALGSESTPMKWMRPLIIA